LHTPLNYNKITVLIPTLNEAKGIRPTIEEIKAELVNPLIIVVDACSSDGTPEIAQSLGAKVLTSRERGKGKQIALALKYVPQDTKWLVMVDGDYTMPAVYIPLMIGLLEKRRDVAMVTGNRMFYRRKEFWSNFRSGATVLGSKFSRPSFVLQSFLRFVHYVLNGVEMEDPTSGMRVIKYGYIKDCQPKAEEFDIEVEMNYFIQKQRRLNIVEFPILRLYWTREKRVGPRRNKFLRYAKIFRRMIIIGVMRIIRLGNHCLI